MRTRRLEALPAAQRRATATGAAGLLSVESFTHALAPPPPETLAALAALCDVLSPNELEARSMLGAAAAAAPAPDLAKRLLAAGAPRAWLTAVSTDYPNPSPMVRAHGGLPPAMRGRVAA
jgi:sugar/nucleoside kinase (ribokinase family)